MTTELSLQNSISLEEQTKVRKKLAAKKDIDYSKYQIGATAYAPKGHLVNDPAWKAPINEVKDTFQNVQNIGKGLKGEGNDHNLGMMNDLTMKAGGLAVAGYLATKRVLPVQKGMEFVGFASFFTSMVLWPKVFINAPIKALYGFNVDQKCVDSQGRKNNVHRDPQYFVSDLYSSEQLDSIGDKMGVDKDMENRQGLIKEKMTKISTQANTLWMLTAGLATPIMGALISSQVEKGLNLLHQNVKTKQIDNKFAALGEELSKPGESKVVELPETLNKLIADHKDKAVGPKFIEDLSTIIAGEDNHMLKNILHEDLTSLMESGHVADVSEFFGTIEVAGAKGKSAVLPKETIKKVLEQSNLNANIDLGKETGASNIMAIRSRLTTAFKKANPTSDNATLTSWGNAFKAAFDTKIQTAPMKLTTDKINIIEAVHKSFSSFREKSSVLNEYVVYKVGDREDSVMAREWKKSSEGICKALGFTDKELSEAKSSPTKTRQVMEAKFTEIAKDDTKYETAIKEISNCLTSFETEVERGSIKTQAKDKEGKEITKTFIEGVTDVAVKIYSKLGSDIAGHKVGEAPVFKRTADYLSAHFEKPASIKKREMKIEYLKEHNDAGGIPGEEAKIKQIKESVLPKSAAFNVIHSADNKIIGAKASLTKILHAADLFRRLTNPDEVKKLKAILKESAGRSDKYLEGFTDSKTGIKHPGSFDKIVGVMKYAVMDATLGTNSVKFDLAHKEIYKDAMMLLYCMDQDHIGSKLKAFLKNDELTDYSKNLPKVVDLDPKTVSALGGKDAKATTKLRAHLADMADITVNEYYRFKPEYSFLDRYKSKDFSQKTSTLVKQMMVGETASNLTQKIAEQKSNTKHWLKLFGGIGAGVAAITLVAPLFFGKVKAPQSAPKEVASNG